MSSLIKCLVTRVFIINHKEFNDKIMIQSNNQDI